MNWYLLAVIPVLGLLVLVHEFGHFIAAKWAGIRVEEFGLGLPPRIVGARKRDSGGWEVVWLGGKETAEDNYSIRPQEMQNASHHTIYSLNFLPIGGFVRMPGENGDVNDENGKYDAGSFAAKSAGKRVWITHIVTRTRSRHRSSLIMVSMSSPGKRKGYDVLSHTGLRCE